MGLTTNNLDQMQPAQIYKSLLLPFSTKPSPAETAYQSAGLQKTKGTIFITPPPESLLRSTYNAPPRAKTRMSSGAVALCKHFERTPGAPRSKRDRSGGQRHPFWTEPKGSNEAKTAIAAQTLDRMLWDTCWRNVMLLHRGVAVYEIRNRRGWGMRWTLEVEESDHPGNDGSHHQILHNDALLDEAAVPVVPTDNLGTVSAGLSNGSGEPVIDVAKGQDSVTEQLDQQQSMGPDLDEDPNSKQWAIKSVAFRGFLEPIEGMDDEVYKVVETPLLEHQA